jgi:hypothetical protein
MDSKFAKDDVGIGRGFPISGCRFPRRLGMCQPIKPNREIDRLVRPKVNNGGNQTTPASWSTSETIGVAKFRRPDWPRTSGRCNKEGREAGQDVACQRELS